MNKTKNSNLEFRKIKSLNYLYEVNENGTIFRNVKSKKQLKIKLDYHHSKRGYYTTFVHMKDKIKRVPIHKAVAECWLGPIPEGLEVDHRDRNSHNNDYRNLRYVTKSEQMKNRDHTNIIKKGTENLRVAREDRKKAVNLEDTRTGQKYEFGSYADAARFLDAEYGGGYEKYRWKIKAKRKKIFDYKVLYIPLQPIYSANK